MLLKSFNGSIVEVAKVDPIVEKRDSFNGEVQRRVAVAKDMEQDISGVLFHIQHPCANMGVFSPCSSSNDILDGNLSREAVEEIMDSMLKNGYADISGYSYQKEHQCIFSTVFDNGKSDPYYLLDFAATVGLGLGGFGSNMFAPNPMVMSDKFGVADVDEEDDCDGCKDAEQMRSDIYSMSDKYTITQLANMGEDELSDILKGLESEF